MAIKEFWFKNKKYSLQINKKDSNTFEIQLINKTIEAKIFKILPDEKIILRQSSLRSSFGGVGGFGSQIIFFQINHTLHKAKITKDEKNKNKLLVFVFNLNKTFEIDTNSPKTIIPALLLKQQSKFFTSSTQFKNSLTSPLAGRIIKIYVKPNQTVINNQILVIIESMKMENEIRAENDAFVKTISISESDLVEQNQMLMTFENRGEAHAKTKKPNEQKTISNWRARKKVKTKKIRNSLLGKRV